MTSNADYERVGVMLELALYGSFNANQPRDPLLLAEEAYQRIRRLEVIQEKLRALAAEVAEPLPPIDGSGA